jgi:hypothetical protein
MKESEPSLDEVAEAPSKVAIAVISAMRQFRLTVYVENGDLVNVGEEHAAGLLLHRVERVDRKGRFDGRGTSADRFPEIRHSVANYDRRSAVDGEARPGRGDESARSRQLHGDVIA